VPSEPSGVWVVGDAVAGASPAPALLEALTPALALARVGGGAVRVLLFATDEVAPAQSAGLLRYGVARVTVLHGPGFAWLEGGARVEAIDRLLDEGRPRALLVVADAATAWWSAYLAARRRLPVATGCVDVSVRGRRIAVRREALNASVHVCLEFAVEEPLPVVLSLVPGSWNQPPAERAHGFVDVIDVDVVPAAPITYRRRISPPPEEANLDDAELVLAGGAGLRDASTFAVMRELAGLLGGAVGASRVAVDAGWARAEEQVGLTGRRVAPLAYVAFGISGSREHMVGVADARALVAVNTDASAPIARASRLFAVADARALLGALVAEARRRRQAAELAGHAAH
jgi:electron transfer flavoprotein alpha subunit